MVPNPSMQVDALPWLRQKGAWNVVGAASDNNQIRVCRQRHERLAAERVTFEHAHHEWQLARLRTKDADDRRAAVGIGVDKRQRVETLRGAVVDVDDICRIDGVDHVAEWRESLVAQRLDA